MKTFTSCSFGRCASLALLAGGLVLSVNGAENTPITDDNLNSLVERRQAEQRKSAAQLKAFHDFQFQDRHAESGIKFVHQAVEDANKVYKPVHYDHGTGLAAADVDGDGHTDLLFVNQLSGNQLWRGLGNGKFEDITAQAGIALADRVNVGASFADIDNDGDPDLLITSVRAGNVLFENLGGGKFRDITAASGITGNKHSSTGIFFDFDRDGLLDLFITNIGVYTTEQRGVGGYYIGFRDAFTGHLKPERAEFSVLYRNLGGGKFADVSKEMNLEHQAWSGEASVCDVNRDGYPDLYVTSMQGDDRFYENIGGKRFEEKTATYFPKTSWGAMDVKFFDYNQDGLMDVFTTDMHSDMNDTQTRGSKVSFLPSFEAQKSEAWCTTQFTDQFLQGASNNVFGNVFYRNDGGGKFTEVSYAIGVETFWPWGMSAGDLNADGYDDLFITAGMGFGFRYAINSLLLNDGGSRFVASEYLVGVEPRLGGKTSKLAFTLDCDGADKNHPLAKGRTGRLPVYEALSSRSSVFVDIDSDGDLDIITNEMNDRPLVLVSNLSERKKVKSLSVKLVGTKSNRDAIGATVQVAVGDRIFTQYHDGNAGYLAQSSLPLYFGLGDAAKVDRIEVTWPSGKKQIVSGAELNKVLTITEPRN